MENKYDVLLILEGTYPFNGGGVSTWAHMLCNKVKNVNYILYSINADLEQKSNYELSKNVKDIIQVPLWSPLEPQELQSYGKKYYKTINRKEQNDEKAIAEYFIPIFKRLLNNIYDENADIEEIDDTIFDMWSFFQIHDYKKTMKSEAVWKIFCKTISEIIAKDHHYDATLYDFTVGMRWIYRFLIPISIDVPRVDISHLTLSGFPVIPALVLKYKYETPIIATEHGVFIRERLIAINSSEYSFFLKNLLIKFSECITKLVYYKSDIILSVNKFNISWEKMYGANPDKIEVIYNGIDPELFTPSPKPNHLKDIPTVVAAARIFELKDILTMIKSCEVVKKVIPNVKYLVYGDKKAVPEYTQECMNLIKELDLENNFSLAGYHENPHQLFCEGDISILTSISEGFPYTVLESMSCGIPVVATDVGGVTEALDNECGFICKPKDYDEIGKSVITLLQNDALRKQMGIKARQKIVDNFTVDKFIKEYEFAYEYIIHKKTLEPSYLQELLHPEESMEAS
jgi:glycosyltransferase involved in cell wall biosynthesis